MWKYSAPAGGAAAAQPAPAAHPLPPPAAPLPPVQAPPAAQLPAAPAAAVPTPAQPAAGAPAAAPAGRRRRSASQTAAPAPTAPAAAPVAPQPAAAPGAVAAPAVLVPQPVAAPVNQVALPAGGWLSMIVPPPTQTRSALAAIAEVAEQKGGEPNLFPTIELTGGSTGGMFDYDTMNEEGSDDDLVTGRRAFYGVLLTFRYLMLSWPAGFVKGVKRQPNWRAAISSGQPDAASLAISALKQYQMRQRPGVQGAPEPLYDQWGHPQMSIEALVFEPKVGLMVVRSAWSYDSVVFTAAQLGAAFPGGQPQPVPVTIQPHTFKTPGSKKNPDGWDEHGVMFTAPTLPLSADIQQVMGIFQQFYSQAGQDSELAGMLQEWCSHTLTPDQAASLQQIASTRQ